MLKRYTPIPVTTLLLFCMATLFSHCAKEYSYEGGPLTDSTVTTHPTVTPDAEYSLTVDGVDCSDPGIRGTYEAGTNMTSANYIELLVDVVSVGTYTISTETLDGIGFSANGEFKTTGVQRVIVPAKGNPELSRNLVFHVDAGKTSCTFNLTVLMPGYPATYVLESDYDTSCAEHIVNGAYTAGIPLSSSNTIHIKTYVTVGGVYSLATQTLNGVTFYNSGQFMTPGINFIDLIGEGTPLSVGSFTYGLRIVGPAPIGGAACNFDIQVK